MNYVEGEFATAAAAICRIWTWKRHGGTLVADSEAVRIWFAHPFASQTTHVGDREVQPEQT